MFMFCKHTQQFQEIVHWIFELRQIKTNFMASLSGGCASLSFDQGVPKNLQLCSAPSTDQNTIWRYFTLLRLCLALLFFISIPFFSKVVPRESSWITRILDVICIDGGGLLTWHRSGVRGDWLLKAISERYRWNPRTQANPVAYTHQLLRTKDYPSEFELWL